MILVRNYKPDDYNAVAALYKDSTTFGGQFDLARDSAEKLQVLITNKPDAILVAEINGTIAWGGL